MINKTKDNGMSANVKITNMFFEKKPLLFH